MWLMVRGKINKSKVFSLEKYGKKGSEQNSPGPKDGVGLGEETRTLKLFFIKILSPAPWGIGLIVVCWVAYISNMSLLLGLEPFQKLCVGYCGNMVRYTEAIWWSKGFLESTLVQALDLEFETWTKPNTKVRRWGQHPGRIWGSFSCLYFLHVSDHFEHFWDWYFF